MPPDYFNKLAPKLMTEDPKVTKWILGAAFAGVLLANDHAVSIEPVKDTVQVTATIESRLDGQTPSGAPNGTALYSITPQHFGYLSQGAIFFGQERRKEDVSPNRLFVEFPQGMGHLAQGTVVVYAPKPIKPMPRTKPKHYDLTQVASHYDLRQAVSVKN